MRRFQPQAECNRLLHFLRQRMIRDVTLDGVVRPSLTPSLALVSGPVPPAGGTPRPPAQSPPWQEQAARQCEEWALLLSEKSAHAATAFERIQLASNAVKLRDHARAFRALARSEKGEG